MSYFNLLDALKETGCPLCFLVKRNIHKAMDDFLYEQVNDSGVRKEIRESLGFCSLHAWQLQKLGDGFGSSIIYEDLIGQVVTQIEKALPEKKRIKIIPIEILKGKKRVCSRKRKTACPMCRSRREVEKRYIFIFIEEFYEPEVHCAYKNSFGLCLPHLREVVNNCKQKKLVSLLLNIESAKMKELMRELKEIQRKHDYRFSHEGFGKEGNAWIRAIEKMVGKEGVF